MCNQLQQVQWSDAYSVQHVEGTFEEHAVTCGACS